MTKKMKEGVIFRMGEEGEDLYRVEVSRDGLCNGCAVFDKQLCRQLPYCSGDNGDFIYKKLTAEEERQAVEGNVRILTFIQVERWEG